MTENETPKTNSDMLKVTAENLNEFLLQVAGHLDSLEKELFRLRARVAELESIDGDNTTAQ
jgi:hypothetical protein